MSTIASYPKIYNIGHPAVAQLFDEPVDVQEKVDGSQFSFGLINGELICRSKGKQFYPNACDGLFVNACEYVKRIAGILPEGYVFRCEYLQKPKHNTLAYDRTPKNFLMLFDMTYGVEMYCGYETLSAWSNTLEIELVPQFFSGHVESVEQIKHILESKSVLGGQKVEGIVCKSRTLYGRDSKALMGKYVSESFREIARCSWKVRNPSWSDFFDGLVIRYRTPARFEKAAQHMRDKGELTGAMQDIGPLIKELHADTWDECADEIAVKCLEYCKRDFLRKISRGLAEWYKERLLNEQFTTNSATALDQVPIRPGSLVRPVAGEVPIREELDCLAQDGNE